MPQPYPTPPRGATGQALWSYLYQLAEQLNAQAAPAAASETATPNGGSAARIAAEARQTAANALAAVSTAASTVENASTTAENAATAAASAGAKADAASADAASALSAAQDLAEITDALQAGLDAKAPQNHASTQATYGIGNAASYGHVRLSDATGSTSAASGGTAATPAAVKAAYDLASQASSAASSAYDLANEAGQVATDAAQAAVGGKAPTNHASTQATYGKGTSTNYGHVKLSDSILSTSDTAGGTAATPGAVKKAYDLANRAETKLLGGKKIVCGWSAVNFKNTGQQNTTISFGTTFTAKPVVLIGQPFNGVICTVFNDAVTTSNFTVNVPAVGSATLSTRQMAWVAIGSI